jgi:ATP-dependent RNA helicase RhlE
MEFKDLKLAAPLLQALSDEGYEEPTPIQVEAIPPALAGRDLLGSAQTGTGKTAAFALPILHLLHKSSKAGGKRPVRALVLTPTRELASQVGERFTAYGKHTGLRVAVIYGGVRQQGQVAALRNGVDILVATPGRLLDLIGQRHVDLSSVTNLVLDEADRMLDMGFIDDVRKIIARVPRDRQTMFFSATLPPAIRRLADNIVREPFEVTVDAVSSTVDLTGQTVFFVERGGKLPLLMYLLGLPDMARVLVFTRTKFSADRVSGILQKSKVNTAALHSNKTQVVRERTIEKFRNGQIRVLVATDIAARGIDIDDISHVVNFDMPGDSETYVHRVGRTGRAGATGTALSFCSIQERPVLEEVERLIQKRLEIVAEHPFVSPLPAPNPTRLEGEVIEKPTPMRRGRSSGIKRPRRR